MNTRIDPEEQQRFHRLQLADREQHADEVKRMSRAELRRYVTYLRELQRLSMEEYEAMFECRFPAREQRTFECESENQA